MCNKCFQGLMCVDEQAQYQKHLLAFSTGGNSSRAPSNSVSSSSRPGGARGRGRGRAGGAVVFSNGVVIQRQEGLLPSKPASGAVQQEEQQAAPTPTGAAATATQAPPPKPPAAILPL